MVGDVLTNFVRQLCLLCIRFSSHRLLSLLLSVYSRSNMTQVFSPGESSRALKGELGQGPTRLRNLFHKWRPGDLAMGICRSCFRTPTNDGTNNERSPLHSAKTTSVHQQGRVTTAWGQSPTRRGDDSRSRLADASRSQELFNVASEGQPSSSSVNTAEPPYDGRNSESVPCAVAAGPPGSPPSLSAVNKANYHQLSIMLGIGAEEAKRIVNARHVLKGFSSLQELSSVSGITHDTRHKIERKLTAGNQQTHCIGRVEQGGIAPAAVQEAQLGEGGGPPLRVATWNLQQFTTAKASSRPLVAAICNAISSSR